MTDDKVGIPCGKYECKHGCGCDDVKGAMDRQDMEFLKENGQVGDCVRACTASIINVPIETVPHFVRDYKGDWRRPWEDWLEDKGYAVIEVDPRLRPPCKFLACGPTNRKGGDHPAAHMVIYYGCGLYHDPHPSRYGIATTDRVFLIVPETIRAALQPKAVDVEQIKADLDLLENWVEANDESADLLLQIRKRLSQGVLNTGYLTPPTQVQSDELNIIQKFIDKVNRRAEDKMLKPPHKLEGMHYASMTEILNEMIAAAPKPDAIKKAGDHE